MQAEDNKITIPFSSIATGLSIGKMIVEELERNLRETEFFRTDFYKAIVEKTKEEDK